MWFEILPAAGIMFGSMCLGMLGTQFVPWLMLNGHRQYKELNHPGQFAMNHREDRLHGMVRPGSGIYWPKGLENIPDEEPVQQG